DRLRRSRRDPGRCLRLTNVGASTVEGHGRVRRLLGALSPGALRFGALASGRVGNNVRDRLIGL
ncbi:MAG TPA: hypothetical protein DCQ04_09115, partial [Actinobacteria bacterium]|nr:hypothetical protein [Actinomycetota bacterium]